jgi:hypothetical protein
MSTQPTGHDVLIPPEISNDALYYALQQTARRGDVRTILEIGASSGGGSTEALVSGLLANPSKPTLFTIEVSRGRFAALQQRYAAYPQVKCYNVSSVPPEAFPSEAEVIEFYRTTPTALNRYPLELVLSWLRSDLEYIRTSGVPQRGIELIRQENGVDRFDMVLIDGSEFSGRAELEQVYGARFIFLDDVIGFKNWHNFHRLQQDPEYVLRGSDPHLRNGAAMFERVEARPNP